MGAAPPHGYRHGRSLKGMGSQERGQRAAAFLNTGSDYHRLRPTYPDDALDWMLPARARDVHEWGAGTGLLTDSLVARGLRVIAVDPSASMLAELATRHPDVPRVVAAAELSGQPDESADAVLVAQAWHWLDPIAAAQEAARVLRPGGRLAMIWNQRLLANEWQRRFDAVQSGARGVDAAQGAAEVSPSLFGPREEWSSTWQREVSAEEYLALYMTHSPFLVASADERAERLRRWRALLEEHGSETLTEEYVTYAWRYTRQL